MKTHTIRQIFPQDIHANYLINTISLKRNLLSNYQIIFVALKAMRHSFYVSF